MVGDRVVSGGVSGVSEMHKENITMIDIDAKIFMNDVWIRKIKRFLFFPERKELCLRKEILFSLIRK